MLKESKFTRREAILLGLAFGGTIISACGGEDDLQIELTPIPIDSAANVFENTRNYLGKEITMTVFVTLHQYDVRADGNDCDFSLGLDEDHDATKEIYRLTLSERGSSSMLAIRAQDHDCKKTRTYSAKSPERMLSITGIVKEKDGKFYIELTDDFQEVNN